MGAGTGENQPPKFVYLIIMNVLQGVTNHTDAHVDQV